MSQTDLGALAGVLTQLLGGGSASGLAALTDKLKASGLDQEVDSWVGPGESQPIEPARLSEALGPHASSMGGSMSSMIAALLPLVVNAMTPQGRLPQHDNEMPPGGLNALLGQLAQQQGGTPGLASILGQLSEGNSGAGGLAGVLGGLFGGRR